MVGDLRIAELPEQRRAAYPLIVAVLEEKRSAWTQASSRASGDRAQTHQTPDQGETWLEAQIALFEMRVSVHDVGRVAHDEIERLPVEGPEPGALPKVDLDRVFSSVAPGELERGLGDVGCCDFQVRPLRGERDRDRPAARSELEHARRRAGRKALERKVDHMLGFRTRDQNVRRYA